MEQTTYHMFQPLVWNRLPKPAQQAWQQADRQLRKAMACAQPTYALLATLDSTPHTEVDIRDSISTALAQRSPYSYSVTQEKTCLAQVMRRLPPRQASIYEIASGVRALLFGQREPLRTFNVSIIYLPWLHIAPPQPDNPVFRRWCDIDQGPPLFAALNLYVLMLSAHPFSDGNGRTARILFNLLLSWRHGSADHYIPLADIFKRDPGRYEELMARAAADGSHHLVLAHLRRALTAYAQQIQHIETPREDDLERAVRLSQAHAQAQASHLGLNETPPYPVGVDAVRAAAQGGRARQSLVQALDAVAAELRTYGRISYVLVRLDDLLAVSCDTPVPVAYFIHLERKEAFTLHVREMRSRYKEVIHLQFAVFTGDVVIDAKVLIGLASLYSKGADNRSTPPAIVHGFDAGDTN